MSDEELITLEELNLAKISVDAEHPYLGLFSFKEEHHDYFFGRDKEINDIFEIVKSNAATLVYGKPGMGKTSLLQAGVIPKLKENNYFPVYIRINFDNISVTPLSQVKSIIETALKEKDNNTISFNDVNSGNSENGSQALRLKEYFDKLNFIEGNVLPVIIFDQFEELFTTGIKLHRDDSRQFLKELGELVNYAETNNIQNDEADYVKEFDLRPLPKYRIIIGIREDYVYHLDSLHFNLNLNGNHYKILHFKGTDAIEAIIRPAQSMINKDVAIKIIQKLPVDHHLHYHPLDDKPENWENKMIEPILLSLFCYQLNERRIELQTNEISFDLVNQTMIKDIIFDHYNDHVKDLSPAVIIAIEENLLTEDGARKMSEYEDFIRNNNLPEEEVIKLLERRIIRKEVKLNNIAYIELIHDVLTPIIKEKRDARRHDEFHHHEELRLAKELELQRKKFQRTFKITVAALIFIILQFVIIWYAFKQKQQVERQRIEARVLKRLAEENAGELEKQKKIVDNLFNKLGIIYGMVIDDKGNHVDSVKVNIDGIEKFTDKNGYFAIEIPRDKLKTQYHLSASKKDFNEFEDEIFPGREDILSIPLEKLGSSNGLRNLQRARILYNKSNYQLAFSLTAKAADEGETVAFNRLGEHYIQGKGIEKDYNKALLWFRKAAKAGDVNAEYNLGNMYLSGSGVIQDIKQAEGWYRTAASQGNAEAQNKLGYIYYKGEGRASDFEEAMNWYTKAARQGKPEALNYLGLMYYMGRGVKRDYVKAYAFYKKAADKGIAAAMNNLGVCYQNGNGVEQNLEEAVYWYKKASELGSEPARDALKSLGMQ